MIVSKYRGTLIGVVFFVFSGLQGVQAQDDFFFSYDGVERTYHLDLPGR